jgi:membrane protein YqaA with SNARE-associated domain
MTARHEERLLYYAAMATAGSLIGAGAVDFVARRDAAAGIRRLGSEQRLKAIQRKVAARAGWVLAIAAVIPPPFPYKVFFAAAAALQYPRKKLFLITAGARFVRFTLEGLAAVYFGAGILRLADTPALRYGVAGLVLLSIAGSAITIYRWVR